MNIIAKIAHILTDEPLEGFALAEARVYDMGILAPSLAAEIKRFVPTC
jgi:phosphohistidine phosphatase